MVLVLWKKMLNGRCDRKPLVVIRQAEQEGSGAMSEKESEDEEGRKKKVVSGCLNLGITDIWGQIILCHRELSCVL